MEDSCLPVAQLTRTNNKIIRYLYEFAGKCHIEEKMPPKLHEYKV